ncbi:MAG TPA: PIN domain-containing protein [Candidatus Acidoferrum sp.]
MSSEFSRILKRLRLDKPRRPLRKRPKTELDFVMTTSSRPTKLLYDTTVFVDILQDRFPHEGECMLRAADAWHSPVTEAELAATCGLLDPGHPETRGIIEQINAVIEQRPSYRTIVPDCEVWREAGVLSGMIARLQGYGKDQRRRAMNDALLFATARKYGCTVLTRNTVDFDFLQQLDPSGRVLFYTV